jgi:nucleolar protein 56
VTDLARRQVVPTWFGVLVLEGPVVLAVRPAPSDAASVVDRMRTRRAGQLTPEEQKALAEFGDRSLESRDRRLTIPGGPSLGGSIVRATGAPAEFAASLRREAMLALAEEALRASWDPSIHVEEAIRSIEDLDAVRNSVGERLVSWASRDVVDATDEGPASADALARMLLGPEPATDRALGPTEPELVRGRQALAELYQQVGRVRAELERSVEGAMPRRAPNVVALLGPLLSAKILSLAGGLDRLARLPASTIQVLGAEKAFFEHLRGRASPPRHGVLFLHPVIQGAPRRQRGKLARALAGKVAIAARLDREGSPVRAELLTSFEARTKAVRAARPTAAPNPRRSGSRPPLHRTSEHR